MAFNRSDTAQLAELVSEIQSDPLSMGYNPSLGTQSVIDLLNIPDNNLAPAQGGDIATAEKLLKAIYPAAISSQDQFKIQLTFEIARGANEDLSRFKSDIGALSTGLQAAVDGITRPLSRADVLWGAPDSNGVHETITLTKQDMLATELF